MEVFFILQKRFAPKNWFPRAALSKAASAAKLSKVGIYACLKKFASLFYENYSIAYPPT
jgi:hypothetical protein